MRGFNFAAQLTRRTGTGGAQGINTWTCRQCLSQARGTKPWNGTGTGIRRGFATKNQYNYANAGRSRRSPNRRVLLAAATVALGATAAAFTDDVKHAYNAVERTGRVVSTLAVCINE
jgi:aarF domain-containing kinase